MARKTISQRIALTGGDEIKKQLKGLGESGEKAFDEIQRAAEKLKGPGAQFARNMDNAIKKIREAGDAMKRTGEKIRNFGAGMSVAITAPVALIGKSFLDAASDAEEARSAFNFMFGDNAAEVRKWADTVAGELGRGSQAIQDQAMAFQQLFAQVQPDKNAAADLSKDFTVLAQDLASFYNIAEEDALGKLMSGLAGESEPLRAFGIFMNDAAVQAKALEMGLKGVNDPLTDQEKVLVRAQLIWESTTKAQGDATRTSGSYANQLKRLNGLWTDLSIALGEVILPAALQVVQAISKLIVAFQNLPASTQTLIVALAGVAAVIGPILGSIGFMVMGLGGLATAFSGLVGLMAPIVTGFMGLGGGAGLLASAFTSLGPIIAGIAAALLSWPVLIAGLVASFAALGVAIYQNWDRIGPKVAEVWAVIAAFGANLYQLAADMASAVGNGVSSIIEAFTSLGTKIGDAVQGMFKSFLTEILGFEGEWVDTFARILRYVTVDWVGGLKDAIGGAIDMVKGAVAAIKSLWSSTEGGGGSSSGDGGGILRGFASGGNVRGPGTGTSDSILARLSNGEYVIQARAVRHYGTQLFDLLNRLRMPKGKVPGFATGGSVSTSVRNFGDTIRSQFSHASSVLNNAIPAFAKGGAVSLAIPAFATGGAVTLAMPEFPVGGLMAAAPSFSPAGGGSGEPLSVVNLTIGGETFGGLMAPRDTADQLVRFAMNEQAKSAGRRPGWYKGS